MMGSKPGAPTAAEAGALALLAAIADPEGFKVAVQKHIDARTAAEATISAANNSRAELDKATAAAQTIIEESKAQQAKAKNDMEKVDAEVKRRAESLDVARAEISRAREALQTDKATLEAQQREFFDTRRLAAEKDALRETALSNRESAMAGKEAEIRTRLDEANALKATWEAKLNAARTLLEGGPA
jgi:chromosome segregation ATPase